HDSRRLQPGRYRRPRARCASRFSRWDPRPASATPNAPEDWSPNGSFWSQRGIECGRIELAMPQQDLDDANVDILFQQMGCEAVAQRMGRDPLPDPSRFGRLMRRAVDLPGRDRIGATAPWEQPAMPQHDPASLAFFPPQPQQREELG